MNRNFLYLAMATLVVLLAVYFLAQREDRVHDNSIDPPMFMPDLANTINDVDRVNVVVPGNLTLATLIRENGLWQVEQMDGYAANWPRLQKLLAGLAKAKVTEIKTNKPEYYSRLGVADLASEDADGIMLELHANGTTEAVIIGHRVKNRPGNYVRLQSSQASHQIDQTLDVPSNLLDWVNKRIVDINASEVAQVEVIHPDQQRVLIMRISADQKDFELADKPFDREIRSVWAVNSLAGTLSMLDMENVRPASDEDWSGAVKVRVLLFSGVEIIADVMAIDESEDTQLEYSTEDPQTEGPQTEYLLRLKASNPKTDFAPLDSNKAALAMAEEVVKKQVSDINQRVEGWVYSIPKPKFDAMVKTPEDLLKPVQTEE